MGPWCSVACTKCTIRMILLRKFCFITKTYPDTDAGQGTSEPCGTVCLGRWRWWPVMRQDGGALWCSVRRPDQEGERPFVCFSPSSSPSRVAHPIAPSSFQATHLARPLLSPPLTRSDPIHLITTCDIVPLSALCRVRSCPTPSCTNKSACQTDSRIALCTWLDSRKPSVVLAITTAKAYLIYSNPNSTVNSPREGARCKVTASALQWRSLHNPLHSLSTIL
jgi:hypothetical protein